MDKIFFIPLLIINNDSKIKNKKQHGKKSIHQYPMIICWLPSLMSSPNPTIGGWIPSPRKPKKVDVDNTLGTESVVYNITLPIRFLIICLNIICLLFSPAILAASMYSLFLSSIVCPRIIRAISNHETQAIAMNMFKKLRPKIDINNIARKIKGIAQSPSTQRIMMLSILPPQNPDIVPYSVPMKTAMTAETNDILIDI